MKLFRDRRHIYSSFCASLLAVALQLPSSGLTELDLPPVADLTPDAIQKQFGTDLNITPDGKCCFSIKIDNKERVSIESAASQEALHQTRCRLQDLQIKLQRELENQYNVRIGHDGEMTGGEGYGPRSKKTYFVEVRSPKLADLCALEYALAHSAPSHLTGADNTGIHVYFLKQRRSFSVLAEWGYALDNRPAIFLEPNYRDPKNHVPPELVMVHELSHNAQIRMGLDSYRPQSWNLAAAIGWFPFENPDTGESGWLFASKESSNHFYKFAQYTHRWVRCNRRGQPLSEDGTKVETHNNARCLSTQQMMEVAQVRPATTYFTNPMEMYAEAMTLFRSGREHRKELMLSSPALYEIVKEQDQLEIASVGNASIMRNLDGLLVADLPENRREVAEFESRAIASASVAADLSSFNSR